MAQVRHSVISLFNLPSHDPLLSLAMSKFKCLTSTSTSSALRRLTASQSSRSFRFMTSPRQMRPTNSAVGPSQILTDSASPPPPLSLSSNHWEDANLAPLSFVPFGLLFNSTILPAARALTCTLRSDPKIVIPPKLGLSTNTDAATYAFLLLNSPWRSDAELRAGQSSWRDALRFHGLSPPDVPEIYTYSCRLFEYMLTSCRYSSRDLAAAITRMSADITPFVQTLQETCDSSLRPVLRKVLEELPNPNTMPCLDFADPVPSCDPVNTSLTISHLPSCPGRHAPSPAPTLPLSRPGHCLQPCTRRSGRQLCLLSFHQWESRHGQVVPHELSPESVHDAVYSVRYLRVDRHSRHSHWRQHHSLHVWSFYNKQR